MTVNTAGFRPLSVRADKNDKFFYQIEVLVPANSSAKSVADLKGKTVGMSALSSNSSAKAPFVLFHDEFKLNPRSDFQIRFTGTYRAALSQVVKGEVDATCIASDLLARELVREPMEEEKKRRVEKLTEDKFKRIYKSSDYPKLCFGISPALSPDRVMKIKLGFDTFAFAGNSVGEKYKSDAITRFRPIDDKKDWEPIRKVDDRLVEILKAK